MEIEAEEKKGAFFDSDGTTVSYGEGENYRSCWDYTHKFFGTEKEGRKNYEDFHDKKFSFPEWCNKDVQLWTRKEKIHVSKIKEIFSNPKLTPGAAELFGYLHERGYFIAIVSHGFLESVLPACEKVNSELREKFEKNIAYRIYAHKIVLDSKGYLTGQVVASSESKAETVREICKKHKLNPEKSLAFGDTDFDATMLEAVGTGIAVCPAKNAKIRRIADFVVERDLREAMPYLEIRKL